MCRMFACIGNTSTIQPHLLQFQALSRFGNSLDGKGHQDGWGIGYYVSSSDNHHAHVHQGLPRLVKKGECAFDNPVFITTVRKVTAAHPWVVMAHLRKASPGTPCTVQETHPFQQGDLLFCHNGTIFSSEHTPLGPNLDSVILFERIVDYTLEEAVEFFWGYQYTSLSFILTDGRTIWAYRDFRKDEQYYTLYHITLPESVVVCSEPLFPGDWKLLQNHELISISSDLDIRSTRLSSKSPASGVP